MVYSKAVEGIRGGKLGHDLVSTLKQVFYVKKGNPRLILAK